MTDKPVFFPGAVREGDEEPWRIQRADLAEISLGKRIAKVPQVEIEAQAQDRLHALLKAKFGQAQPDPKRYGQEQNDLFEAFWHALEDVRIDKIAQENDIDQAQRYDMFDWGPDNMPYPGPDDQRTLALGALGVWQQRNRNPRPFFEHAWKNMRNDVKELVARAISNVRDEARRPEVVAEWATTLAKRLAPPPVQRPQPNQMAQELAEALAEEAERQANAERGEGEQPDKGGIAHNAGQIGRMEIHDHINRRNPGQPIRRPWGAIDIGQIPENWHRWVEDRGIFKLARPGGTLLLDISGSMDWDFDALHDMMKEFPAATIAVYGGWRRDMGGYGPPRGAAKGTNGRLCILAKEGQWTPYVQEYQATNMVDYEGLLWLCEQRKPRLWLSDGNIHGGMGELKFRDNYIRAMSEIMRKNNIYRSRSTEPAIKFLRTGGRRSIPGISATCQEGR